MANLELPNPLVGRGGDALEVSDAAHPGGAEGRALRWALWPAVQLWGAWTALVSRLRACAD